MTLFARLREQTAPQAFALSQVPQLVDALSGRITRSTYVAYLEQAYHHVRHTAPLMAAAKARLDAGHARFRDALDAYIEEETGHEEWILDDIAACGGDKEAVRRGAPDPATELMVAYAYHMVDRVNPMGFFGMVYVLESTSVLLAARGADAVQSALGLPAGAFRYLRSHGALDQEHMRFFEGLMDAVDDPDDQQAILHTASMMFRLFADVFRAMPTYEVSRAA